MVARLGAARSTPAVTGRFTADGYAKAVAELKAKRKELAVAKKAVSRQKGIMMRAMFSPEGYKKALAHLHRLEKRVATLTKEVAALQHRMMVS